MKNDLFEKIKKGITDKFSYIIVAALFTIIGGVIQIIFGAISFQLGAVDKFSKLEAASIESKTNIDSLTKIFQDYINEKNVADARLTEKVNQIDKKSDRVESKMDQLLLNQQ